MMRHIAGAAAVALVGLSGAAAVADSTPDCKDIRHQVLVYKDPYGLDKDHDGIGCESYPGPATAIDVDPAPGSNQPELAHTGGYGPATHPIRWSVGAGVLVAGGAGLVIYTRRKR